KRGWVSVVVARAGIPMTLDELDPLLREVYQDYEPYVLQQLNLDDDEEGENFSPCRVATGLAGRVPSVVVPSSWELDLAKENVAEEVKRIATRIVSSAARTPYPKENLRRVPWLIDLCNHYAYGHMVWSQGREDGGADDLTIDHKGEQGAEVGPAPASKRSALG